MNDISANNQYVIFTLNKESYGIPIQYVETIERVPEMTRIPNTPVFIKGVINLRGEVIPVVDLYQRFHLNQSNPTNESRIIVLTIDEMTVGILVGSSSEVLKIEREAIDNATHLVNTFEDDYVNGIGKVGERMIIVLDIPKILGIAIEA
ncbi:putative CheW protein [Alkaliphilus metalliredigens QYMF]|uniref:Putative CheW protein n=1 Tax=Alkaliphilus metalliredigens (strain QYMF) TaxID=293826 RepID=A6TRN1_ALKMQ|nr:chemotaxis protein CheW [Alkaliphilus metalliredigens]ABR48849.1 putative CheW protein [Alkaliphilus metalliredigens QYMF]